MGMTRIEQVNRVSANQESVAHELALMRVATAVEQERRWIAAEVHDRIAQTLAGVLQQIRMLEPLVGNNPPARRGVLRASFLVRQSIRECRDIMKELHPPGLDEFGVLPLMEEELEQLQAELGCEARLDCDGKIRESGDLEVTLYRIFHEALINIRRHAANAGEVTVTLARVENRVMLRIDDDGPGFDPAVIRRKGHVGGLMSMQQRAEAAGGTCEIASAPGVGTRVMAWLPASLGRPNKVRV